MCEVTTALGAESRGVVRGGRLGVENVGAVAAEFSGLKRLDHVGDDNDLATGAVQHDGAVAHLGDLGAVDHVASRVVEETVEGDDVGIVQDFVHVGALFDAIGGGEFVVEVGIVGDDGHGEGSGAGGDFLANASETDDAHGLVHDLVADGLFPAGLPEAVFHVGGVGLNLFRDAEQEAEGVLCDGRVVDPGGEEDGKLVLGRAVDVDLVEADAVLGDDLKAGQGLFDDGAGDGVVAAEKGVNVTGELEHAFLGQGAAFAHNLEALGLEEVVVRAGGVLVRGGGEKDSFHGREGSS